MGVAGLMAAPVSQASLTVFNSEAAWLSLAGTSFVEDFDDTNLHANITAITGGDISVAPTNAGWASGNVFHAVADPANPPTSQTFTFDFAMNALGGLWDLAGPGGPGTSLTLGLVGGGTQLYENFFANSLAGTFQGFISTTYFNSITLTAGTGCCRETYELDDLQFSATAVPEPETYAMLLAGLGLLGFLARRRRNSLNVA